MPIVSDTSPLWNLASIERLDLLREQFYEVLIPEEVLAELQVGREYPEMDRIQKALDSRWIRAERLKESHLKQSLMLKLDVGESAAIALAMENDVHRILIDETDGRTTAKAMGLQPIGVLGVLLRAKKEGNVESLKREMNKLRHESGFFISDQLFHKILAVAGE